MYLTWRTPAAMALCALAVLFLPTMALVWVWAAAVVIAIAIDVLAAPNPAQLSCERTPLDSVHLGESTTSRLRVRNTGTRSIRGAVRDAWLPGAGPGKGRESETMSVNLAAGQSGTLEVPLTPTRRGFRHSDQVCVRTRGPLGLAGRQRSRDVPGILQVLPAFASRRALPSRLVQLRELDGSSQVRTFGRGSEFDSLREYVRGDDVRSIDWRATARSREPIVRTWRPERDRRVVIMLDTSRLSAGRLGDTMRLDAGMDACLLLTALAAHAGDNVIWMAGDRQIAAEVNAEHAAPGDALRRLLNAMTPLEAHLVEPDWRLLARRIQEVARKGALVVLVTPFAPAPVEENLLPNLPNLVKAHRVVIASVADPALDEMRERRGTIRDTYDAAAAERMTLRTDELHEVLAKLSVGVLHRPADELPGALADRYLALKREGLL